MKPPRRSEASVLNAVRKYLKARGILFFRMQVGVMKNPKGQFIRFGHPGQADILAFTKDDEATSTFPLWIECKSSTGKLSRDQVMFSKIVRDNGHFYLVVRSAEELHRALEGDL